MTAQETNIEMRELAILLMGALGALVAIFLKEAVQRGLQRRVITWQLFGYLIAWKSNIVRAAPICAIYLKVEAREKYLTESYSEGTEAFHKRWMAHSKERDEAREAIKKAVLLSVSEGKLLEMDGFISTISELSAEALAQRRTMIADSKLFISDKDVSLLGRAVAMNVIQFKTSVIDLLSAIEGVVKLAGVEGEQRAPVMAHLVDQVVIHGEEALVALIRLDRQVDALSKQSIPQLVINVLRGR
jgi:hypothetical protein